ncbi:anti-sigma regulatory factor (Ser/Thr protein kinase) [Actinopolyspora biskrensis]|uniref:histidine kinase n=1 Tax=Actinopolyspora biskrensis TaxID=1470178 RepID=A0A852YWP8_9ACTN|nr:anti-sigma regulatory factor (Ser/Thr protein kinase) [Actinopolyspora biskrensis]
MPLTAVLGAGMAMLVAVDRSYWIAALAISALGVTVALLIGFIAAERAKNVVGLLRRQHDESVRRTAATSTEAPSPADPPSSSPYSNDGLQAAFAKLARRLESMADRAITEIDEAEHQVEDPELLGRIFRVDHLVNLSRRQAENLAILGGKAPQRQSQEDVSLQTVLRSAVAEIEHYSRVKMAAVEGTLKGPVIAEVIHLLAELLENATRFSRDNTPVVLRTETVTAGLAIEIQDRGLGMTSEEIQRYNRLLDDADRVDLDELLADGRIGLSVVRVLAQRYNIKVRLQTSIYGGMEAVVLLPDSLLGTPPQEPAQPGQPAQELPTTSSPNVPSEPAPGSVRPGMTRWTGDVAEPAPAPSPGGHDKVPGPPQPEPAAAPVPPPPEPARASTPSPSEPAPQPPRTYRPPAETTSSTTGGHRPRGAASDLPQRRPGKDNLPAGLQERRESVTPIPGHNTGLLGAFGQSDTGDPGTSGSREDHSNSN